MKRIIIIVFSFIFIAVSCAKDIVDLTGVIQGTVEDYYDEQLIKNCKVSLSPGGSSSFTNEVGSFVFRNIEPGTYTLSFTKSGYGDETLEVTVFTGRTSSVIVFLEPLREATGKIAGAIKDYKSGQLISNCKVSLTPSGKSVTSSLSGTYEFDDLEPGQYSISFIKAGYNDEKASVSVSQGKTTTMDALLSAKAAFALSETSCDFGDMEEIKTIYFYNYSDSDCSFSISDVPSWLYFDKNNGTIRSSGNVPITARVYRSGVIEGVYNQNVTISYSGKESGTATLSVSMKKVALTTPTIVIGASGENVKQDSFDISGTITATGGSKVTSYGHCWNLMGNPSIQDSNTNFGTTSSTQSFRSTVSNLSANTTVYVRAYAQNAQGISYSDQVVVTTQDIESDKWDGSIATSFAGGSGTIVDPYVIKTGGQLLLIRNFSDKYFVLGGNIDLDNRNWRPERFDGNLDGKGFIISNLRIERTYNRQGLFSECFGRVSNLTINKVYIKAESNDYVGAISGSGGTFENCKVILDEESKIIGNKYVGGVCGWTRDDIINCQVESLGDDSYILGNNYVGGVAGRVNSDLDISNCNVKCSVYGEYYVGGLFGTIEESDSTILNSCSYTGKIVGKDFVGGIVGYMNYVDVIFLSCKVDADINGENSIGGLCGSGPSASKAIACYTKGTITSEYYPGGLFGSGTEIEAYLCYSTMTSKQEYYGIGKRAIAIDCATVGAISTEYEYNNKNTKASCTDVTAFLQDSYSQYLKYWNFQKSWVWRGEIDGKTVEVKCPLLLWE